MESDKSKIKVIAVIGPTASGKTGLAIKLAKKYNGELINADSRQIYKYLDIGTAKGTVVQIRNQKLEIRDKLETLNSKLTTLGTWSIEDVPLHLINIVEPDEILTLAQYQKLAYAVIRDIHNRGKLPILVGGTGLYIDAIVKGYTIPRVKPDQKLREQLNSKTVKQLQAILKKANSKRYAELNESDRNNPRRLIRAIEVARSKFETRNPKLETGHSVKQAAFSKRLDVKFISPKYTREQLYDRINKRVHNMLEEGLLDEVQRLLDKGYTFDKPSFSAIAYPLAEKYLKGELSKEEFIEKWQQKERNYARRQVTWFKRHGETVFVSDADGINVNL